MRYKVGDTPTVKSDLDVRDEKYGCDRFVPDMEEFKGKKVTIRSVWKNTYGVKENIWNWTDEMFEDPTITISKWGELDKIKNDRYRISVDFDRIYVYELINPWSKSYLYLAADNNLILEWLKLFGFEVEFKKHPTLTTTQMDIVKGLIALEKIAGKKVTYNLLSELDLFKSIKNGQNISLEELATWDVE